MQLGGCLLQRWLEGEREQQWGEWVSLDNTFGHGSNEVSTLAHSKLRRTKAIEISQGKHVGGRCSRKLGADRCPGDGSVRVRRIQGGDAPVLLHVKQMPGGVHDELGPPLHPDSALERGKRASQGRLLLSHNGLGE